MGFQSVQNLKVTREAGSTNLWATWEPTAKSKSDPIKSGKHKGAYNKRFKQYEYNWYYRPNGSSTWWPASASDTVVTDRNTKRASFSIPSNAVAVYFTIKTVMYKKKWKKNAYEVKTGGPNFDATTTASTPYYVSDSSLLVPAVPSPSHTIDKNNVVTFTVNVSTEEVNKGVNRIFFNVAQVIKTGGIDTYKIIHHEVGITVSNNKAVWHITLPGGYSYVYQAKAYIGSTDRQSAWSDWSSQTEMIHTKPAKPTWTGDGVKLNTASSIRLSFKVTGYAEEYEIEYAEKQLYLTGDSSGMSQTTSITEEKPDDSEHNKIVYIDNLETGKVYFIRIRAKSSKFDPSEWSDIRSISIGRVPGPPSTYSSKTAAKIGDTVKLYWVHNTQDGSSQTSAELELSVNNDKTPLDNSTIIYTNPYYENEYERDKTLFYQIDLIANSQYRKYADTDKDKTHDFQDGDVLRWRVRTKGVYNGGDNGGYGDYSAFRQITMFSPPQAHLFFKSGWEWDPLDLKDHTVPLDQLPTTMVIDRYPYVVVMSSTPDTQQAISFNLKISNAGPSYETENAYGEIVTIGEDEILYQNYFDIEDLDKDVTNQKTLVLYPNDIHFVNGKSYKFTLDVYTNSGLVSDPIEVILPAEIHDAGPFVPEAEIDVDLDNIIAYISPMCYDYNEDKEIIRTPSSNVLLDVYRINTDGTFTLIESNIPNNGQTIVDPHPSLDYARYRIVANKYSTGDIAYEDYMSDEVGIHSLVIQWDESWKNVEDNSEIFNPDSDLDISEASKIATSYSGNMIILPWNIDTSESFNPDVAFVEYIGREHPVSYYGTQLGQTASWSTLIVKYDPQSDEYQDFDTNLLFKLRKLARHMGDCYVREPSGTGYWANVNVNWSQTHNEPGIPVSIEVKRVEGGI